MRIGSEISAYSASRLTSPESLAALASCLWRSLWSIVICRFANRRDGHRLVMKFADPGHAMRRDFPIGVKAELRHLRPELGARGFEFVHGVLPIRSRRPMQLTRMAS